MEEGMTTLEEPHTRMLAKHQKTPYSQTKVQVLLTGHSLNYLF